MDTAAGRRSFLEVFNGRVGVGKPEYFGRSVIVSPAPARTDAAPRDAQFRRRPHKKIPGQLPLARALTWRPRWSPTPQGVRLQAVRDPPVRSAASAETALQADDAAAP